MAGERVVAEPELPPFPASTPGGLWDARSARIPFVEPWPVSADEPVRPTAPVSYLLDFGTGREVTVTGAGIIGRAPQGVGGESALQLVRIDDPGRSVSKVHARFEIDRDGLWIEDLGSGNGTTIEQPGMPAVDLRPGQRYAARAGAVVRIGRQSFTVR